MSYVYVLYKGCLNPSVLGIYTDEQAALDEMARRPECDDGTEYLVEETPLNELKTRFNVRVVGCK
jgi:hypothetical protein